MDFGRGAVVSKEPHPLTFEPLPCPASSISAPFPGRAISPSRWTSGSACDSDLAYQRRAIGCFPSTSQVRTHGRAQAFKLPEAAPPTCARSRRITRSADHRARGRSMASGNAFSREPEIRGGKILRLIALPGRLPMALCLSSVFASSRTSWSFEPSSFNRPCASSIMAEGELRTTGRSSAEEPPERHKIPSRSINGHTLHRSDVPG